MLGTEKEGKDMEPNETRKYFADIFARMAQVLFTLLVITPFISNIFSWTIVLIGSISFVVTVWIGARYTRPIEED